MLNFKGHRFPPDIIILAVFKYVRYRLSLEDVVELLLIRGINVSRQTIWNWVHKYGEELSHVSKRNRRPIGKRWHVDETYAKCGGTWKYVYRAVDEDMQVIDVYVSETRDKEAAKTFLLNCLEVSEEEPESVRTDGHRGYDQVKKLFPKARHHKVKCLNNKAESSHVPFKERYRPTRGFKSFEAMGRFCKYFEDIYRFFQAAKYGNRNHRNRFLKNWNDWIARTGVSLSNA